MFLEGSTRNVRNGKRDWQKGQDEYKSRGVKKRFAEVISGCIYLNIMI